ncbi:pyridoxal phosphate-dependent aminotransferase [Caldisalinibacter kiritimatiensis]|uniref:Aminotransferase n=1 Tax=Caldisalinibacter kiritimatiensis TaxID=1304284 RepID=R1CCZ4_9FIRM|nr:pyridoxal phosphate-dependent aminotransferase [Caldisalinibacter kiritimatiensis]EOD00165.1 Aspartate aminotransferase [Caldisalinibacter kiritimatiensis]
MLSERIRNMKPSMTVQLTDKLAELKRRGIDVISLNIGEPDFDTPKNIKEAAKKALDGGFTKYTMVSGIYELREGICEKLKKENNIDYTSDEVVVTFGAKQALTNSLLTLCDKGDEVILLTPCWVSYVEMVKLAEAKPVLIETNEKKGFLPDIKKIEKAITEKTKAILINTPNNPTGAVYPKKLLEKLAQLAVKYNFYIISDEIYEKLVYDNAEHISIASLAPEVKERTITINGFSKAFAMTGWRLGYALGPKEVIEGMAALQGHMTSGTNSIAQRGAVEALLNSDAHIEYMVNKYNERRKYLLDRLNNIELIECSDVKGAFYLFPDVSKLFGKRYKDEVIRNSIDVADLLLEEAYIAVVPGIAFEAPNNIRIAYSNSLDNIKEAMDRMEKVLLKIK